MVGCVLFSISSCLLLLKGAGKISLFLLHFLTFVNPKISSILSLFCGCSLFFISPDQLNFKYKSINSMYLSLVLL